MIADALNGHRVVELAGQSWPVALTGRLLADLGADVTMVEPLAGSFLQGRPGPESPGGGGRTFASVSAGKRPIRTALDTPAGWASFEELLAGADVLIVGRAAQDMLVEHGQDLSQLSGRYPHLIVAVLSPYGLTGPLEAQPGTELVLQALTGVLTANGYPEDPPTQAGIPVARCGSAILAVAAIISALLERRRSGLGQLIDLSEYDALVTFLGTLLPTYFLTGQPFRRIGNRHPMSSPWNAYRTADGWVVLSTMGQSQWRTLLSLIRRVELYTDERFRNADLRVRNVGAVDEVIEAWTSVRATVEVLGAFSAAGLPAAPVRGLAQALNDDHTGARGLVRTAAGRLEVGPLLHLTEGTTPPPAQPADAAPTASDTGASSTGQREAPLDGVRVLEVGSFTAGPLAGRLLGLLGAEVVKIEPPQGEGSRHLAQRLGDTGYLYFVNNTDKFGIQLALDTPDGQRECRRLLAESDVFLTNLASDTLAQLGLDEAQVAQINPRLVYSSITGFGLTGPSASRRAFDTVVQAASGIMSLTGSPAQPPLKVALSIADIFAACTAVAGTVAALLRRDTTGRGQLVDSAMYDAAVWATQFSWPKALEAAAPTRHGNYSHEFCPHDVYLAGDGGWIALAVTDDDQWRKLVDLAADAHHRAELRGASTDERLQRREQIDSFVREWVATMPAAQVVSTLTDLGVAAAIPGGLADVATHPHTLARNLILVQEDPAHGQLHVIGSPFKFSATPVAVRRRAPHLGEHNDRYLSPPDPNAEDDGRSQPRRDPNRTTDRKL